jgi:tRNA A-37 threonylcarbamoyl transferase component Bud32
MVTVVDFDGTLALGDTADINTMYVDPKIVSLVNKMYDDGNTIKIVTARGSKSCSTIAQREEKYRDTVLNWLLANGVKFHELSFNKEYGDVYIDDRAYNVDSTIFYEKLDSKFTTNKVRRINNCVVKITTNSSDEVAWYNKALEIELNIPGVLSYDRDTIATRYIEGTYCSNVNLVLDTLSKFKNTLPTNKVNFSTYVDRITNHLQNNPSIQNKSKLLAKLATINPPNTFNHGDFSIHNQIESANKLYLIDPIYSEDIYQSYVLDAAKHLYSVLYYALDSDFFNICYNQYINKLGIKKDELDILIACESVRVCNRKKQLTDITNNLIDAL